nr:MAG TPA: hypothetical protein [Caudoviricetes sp.]
MSMLSHVGMNFGGRMASLWVSFRQAVRWCSLSLG